jgi:uncharacterized protein (TIGR03000 family)
MRAPFSVVSLSTLCWVLSQIASPQSRAEHTAPATIAVTLPTEAQVFIDDAPTNATGPFRRFTTPPLECGKTYTYEFRATLTVHGVRRQNVHRITVRAGEVTRVSFTNLFQDAHATGNAPKTNADEPVTLANEAYAFLRQFCSRCHNPTAQGPPPYDVLDYDVLLNGKPLQKRFARDKYIVPGDPQKSLIVRRIREGDMPADYDGDFSSKEDQRVKKLEEWINRGAPKQGFAPDKTAPMSLKEL